MPTYRLVPEHDGIEMYFDQKPDEDILKELKYYGWRWHRVKKCWFSRYSTSAEALAKKLCEPSTPHPPVNKPVPSANIPLSFTQNVGSQYVSTLTITPNGKDYQISSTNNQIICCDCMRYFSIHAQACPFCGCPTQYVADTYYSRSVANSAQERERQQQEVQRREQEECNYKHDRVMDLYWNSHHSLRILEQLEKLDRVAFDLALKNNGILENTASSLPHLSDTDWFNFITLGQMEFRAKLKKMQDDYSEERDRELIQQKANEVEVKLNALKIDAICRKYNISNEKADELKRQNLTSDEIQARIDAINFYTREYPYLELSIENVSMSVERIKEYASACKKTAFYDARHCDMSKRIESHSLCFRKEPYDKFRWFSKKYQLIWIVSGYGYLFECEICASNERIVLADDQIIGVAKSDVVKEWDEQYGKPAGRSQKELGRY